MWLFCFFDLPVKTKLQRKMATSFRNHLINDGFIMIQFSVYARVCKGEDGNQKHVDRIRKFLPSEGSIRCLSITDRQYGRMKILLGLAKKNEKKRGNQLILL
ncbi:CRISPR-associated endonuclease Cas2 [Entomobacter blattae]|uniref:CRISPR-associated endoribonuclease Cas2 n=1 Tax=Entomobacter blattae TaxID=2762277 RepID=A0A7H1NS50_9PROT|nr:CRISPR-associated endonuclease Cas2 [Entomobacter blattae]QNT78610.1 CRISPR-associated endoribonuclease Cas2 [Entomobacter blattae]